MLKEIVASNAAKLIAACVCPVATTAALTVSVPQVRQAVHKATAPRAYAKPKTRVRPAAEAAPRLAAAPMECPPVVNIVGNSSIAPNVAFGPFSSPELASNGTGPGGGGYPGGFTGGPGGPGGPGWVTPGSPPPVDPEPPAVPEPETWVQMLIGFGVIGGATRVTYRQQRRRREEEADA